MLKILKSPKLKRFKFERVYHHFMDWEEIDHNMWGTVENKKAWLKRAVAFTSDHQKYGRFMMRVVNEWPFSCENALTDSSLNQKAWVGHAAVALAIGCPENITREAWGLLTDEQRLLANKEADRAIDCWQINYATSKGLLPDVGEEVLC
jgi:hypothetical protein